MMNHVFLWINRHPVANTLDILVYRQILPKLYAHPLYLKHIYLLKGNFALDLDTIAYLLALCLHIPMNMPVYKNVKGIGFRIYRQTQDQ